MVYIPLNALLVLQATNCTGMLNLYRVLFIRWRLTQRRARRSPERMMQIKMIRWMSQRLNRRTLSLFVISDMERVGQLSNMSKDRGVDVSFS